MLFRRASAVCKLVPKFSRLHTITRARCNANTTRILTTGYRSRIRFASGSPKISKILMYSIAAAGISLSVSQYDQIYAATNDLKSPFIMEIDVPVDMSLTKEGMAASAGIAAAGAGAAGTVGALSGAVAGACVAAAAVIGVVGYLGYYTYCVHYCDNSTTTSAPQPPPVDYKTRFDKLLKEKYFKTHGHPTTTYWNHAKKKDKEPIFLRLPQGDHVIVLKPGSKGEFSVVGGDIQAQKYMQIIRSDIMGTQTYENSFSIPQGRIFTRKIKMKLEVQCTEEGNLDIWVFSKRAPITEMQKIVHKLYVRFAELIEIGVERRQEKE